MNLYYVFWMLLIVASLWASLGGFFWAYRHGQFKDQERARFLPLRGEAGPVLEDKGGSARSEAAVVIGILTIGVSGILLVLFMMMVRCTGNGP